jgi:hypothetical protein
MTYEFRIAKYWRITYKNFMEMDINRIKTPDADHTETFGTGHLKKTRYSCIIHGPIESLICCWT